MYFQFNVVTGPKDVPHVVLIRAVAPVEGIEIMRQRRGTTPDKNLTSGPGKLCIAFGIDKSFTGEDLCGDRIWLENAGSPAAAEIAVGKRIGIDYAGDDKDRPWRFWIKYNKYVSRR
jgi:DNA-3-methyladenine glycosylase